MGKYVIRRSLLVIPSLLGLSLLIFFIMRVAPGDVALMLLTEEGGGGAATSENLAKMRHLLGTDRPLVAQYGSWLWGLVRLDPGKSLKTEEPVFDVVRRVFPLTLELATLSLVVALMIAIPTGVLSAIRQDTWIDYLFRIVSIGGIAMPSFWTATLLLMLTLGLFNWMPPVEYVSPVKNLGKNLLQILPASLILGYSLAAGMSRMTRSQMLEVFREDYVRTAWAKGLNERVVVLRHAFKNAVLPIVTIMGLQVGHLLGGTVVVETVFNLPGMGLNLVGSILSRDYPVVQNVILLMAFFFLIINLVVDLTYGWLDPRIRYQ